MKKIASFVLAAICAVCIIWSCSKSNVTKSNNTQTGGGGTTTPPVDTTKPASTPFKTLNYLYSISGTKTVAGIHNREPNATPAVWTDSIYKTTGKFPGFWSGDFLF